MGNCNGVGPQECPKDRRETKKKGEFWKSSRGINYAALRNVKMSLLESKLYSSAQTFSLGVYSSVYIAGLASSQVSFWVSRPHKLVTSRRNAQCNRKLLKTLSRVKTFGNATKSYTCGRLFRKLVKTMT